MRRRFAFALAVALAAILAAASFSAAQATVSDGDPDTGQLVQQLAERCRVWLAQPGTELKSLKYTFHLGGRERVVELGPDGRRVRRSVWQGATLHTGLDALAAAPDAFEATAERITDDPTYAEPFIRLTIRPKAPDQSLRLEVGNGIDGSWHGYYTHSSKEMRLDLDPETLLPVRELHQGSQYAFRDWQEVKPGAWAPRLVVATRGESDYRMHFAWQGGAVWLLTHAEIVSGDRVRPIARVSDVQVNDQAVTVALSAEQQKVDAARRLVRQVLDRNAAWLAPRPSFDSLQYTFHTERQDVTETCVVLRDGFAAIEVTRDGQGQMAKQFGDRKIVLADGRYATAGRGDARAAVRKATPEGNKPNFALQMRRYALTGCQFDLPLFEWGRVLDDAMVELVDGEWNGVPCHVATITIPGRAGYLGCGVMMGFTSWSYVHHLYPEYEVVYIDKERLVPVHETLVARGGERRFEIDFDEYATVDGANGQLVPLKIDIVAADYFTCKYEFQLVDGRHWLLKSAESWFDPALKARSIVGDVRVDALSELTEAAAQQVAAYRDVFESPGNTADAAMATRTVQTLPFRLGWPVTIGAAEVVFTLNSAEQLLLRCTADAGEVDAGQPVTVLLLDNENRLVQAGHAELAANDGKLAAEIPFGHSYALNDVARFVVAGLGDVSGLAGAEVRPFRVVAPTDGAEPTRVRGIADASGKTQLIDVAVRPSDAGQPVVAVHFASSDGPREFQLDASVAAFDPSGRLVAASSKPGILRVEGDFVEDTWELTLPASLNADDIGAVAVGLARGHTTSMPFSVNWMMFVDLPSPFSLDVRLQATDPACWPAALQMLEKELAETLDHGLLGRMYDWRKQQDKHVTPAIVLRPRVDRLLEIGEAASEPATLARVIRLLGFATDPRAVVSARRLLEHDDAGVRDAAAIALGLLGRDTGLAQIDEILERAEPSREDAGWRQNSYVRRDALIALATIRSDASIPAVEKWLRAYIDGSEAVARERGGHQLAGTAYQAGQLAQLLGRLPDPRYLPMLAAALERVERTELPKTPAREELLESILNYGPAAREFIEPRVRRGDPDVIYVVSKSRDESYVGPVGAMLETSTDLRPWYSAIQYLWDRESTEAVDALRRAHERGVPEGDGQEATRLQLAAALAYRGDVRGMPAAFDVLVRLAEPGEPPEDKKARRDWERAIDRRRDNALDVFDRAPTAAVTEFLAANAGAMDDATRLALLAVLEQMHAIPAAVRPRVEQWAKDATNAEVSRLSERLLIRRR